jgi:16S rRNA (guanine527-N7)-methyltransferase
VTPSGAAGPQPPELPPAVRRALPVLEEARRLGLLGPGPVMPHLAHALGFAHAAAGPPPGPAVDLGSGGGVPGLPLALLWPGSVWMLVDASERRTAFLSRAVDALALGDRVEVLRGRAEDLGREPDRRGEARLVVARGFGPPAVTAECACPLLAVGGRLVVSEPPEGAGPRWPAEALALLGAAVGPLIRASAGSYQVLEQVSACPERFPRRPGIPTKRPLF